MKEIYLPSGDVCLVSDEDYDYLRQFNWRAVGNKACHVGRESFDTTIFIHHEILTRMNIAIPGDMEVDHIDQNGFNNQRENLRVVTRSVNGHNKPPQKNNTSGVKGVYFDKSRNMWMATICVRKIHYRLGRFSEYNDAVKARLEAEKRLL